jgi:hypothetical protein
LTSTGRAAIERGDVAEIGIPRRWHTREDSGLVLDRNLVWHHDGERITHPRIVEAFNAGLVPTEDGRFQLRIGNDWAYVTVEGPAYAVTAIDAGPRAVTLQLSDRSTEPLDPATVLLDADGALTVQVKGGRARARFSRDAQFALGRLLRVERGAVVLRLASADLALPLTPDVLGESEE